MREQIKIPVPEGGPVTGFFYPSVKGKAPATIILGHGAGAGQTSRFMVDFAEGLAARGCNATTFNFPYTEQGRKIPDRTEKLEACFRSVIEVVGMRTDAAATGLIIGGKSMGGRIGSQVAATGSVAGVRALVFLGYPLHPPGRPEKLRAEHLGRIRLPMLFVQGSRDAFGTPEELCPIIESLRPQPVLFAIEGGDHSFKVPKNGPVSQEDVYNSALDVIARWAIDIAANRHA